MQVINPVSSKVVSQHSWVEAWNASLSSDIVNDCPDRSVSEWLVSSRIFPASALTENISVSSETAQVTDQLKSQHVQRQRIENFLFAVKNLESPSFKIYILNAKRSDLASPQSNLHRQSNKQKFPFTTVPTRIIVNPLYINSTYYYLAWPTMMHFSFLTEERLNEV